MTLSGVYEDGTDTVPRPADEALYGLRPRVTLSLLLDLPLGQRRDRELETSRAGALVLEAATRRARAEADVAADAEDLVAERGRLADLVEVRRQQAALAREELRTQTDLLPSGQATAADVALARLDVDERELSAWRARADLFLADLRAAALAGDDLAPPAHWFPSGRSRRAMMMPSMPRIFCMVCALGTPSMPMML